MYHDIHSVLIVWNRIGASLIVIPCHILTLLEPCTRILQHMTNTERISIESPLLAQFARVAAKWLAIDSREMDVLSLIHGLGPIFW